MVQILGKLHQPPVLVGTVVFVAFVFVYLNNHDMASHVQQQVGVSPGASTFNFLATHPGYVRKRFLQMRGYSGLLRIEITRIGFVREQMDKAT